MTMDHVTDPETASLAAARASGISVRELTDLGDFESLCLVFQEIWRPDPTNPPVTTEWLRALTKAGNYVAGAFDGDKLIGGGVGFFGPPRSQELHSHIAGVSAAGLGRDIGYALKLHQRAWALSRDVTTISWTYDPLISRNAYFNLVKLGARPAEYLANFYGAMHDSINASDASDRLLIRWELLADDVVAASGGHFRPADVEAERAGGAMVALDRTAQGGPIVGSAGAGKILVAVPRDIETLRTVDPALAREWRAALREVLATAMAAGASVTAFDKTGWYVLVRSEAR